MRFDERLAGGCAQAEIAPGLIGCLVSLNDLADRPPRALADGEVIELGEKRVRHIDTPHVPHAWQARVLYEATTGTLLCGDLFTHIGNGSAVTTDDIVGAGDGGGADLPRVVAGAGKAAVMRALAAQDPETLALMHGSSFRGDGARALMDLADAYQTEFLTA